MDTANSGPPVESAPLERLTSLQRSLLQAWLPHFEVEQDHSWSLGTTVLAVSDPAGRKYIIKAGDGGVMSAHFKREIDAHAKLLEAWVSIGRAPRFVHADLDAQLIVTEYLPGQLVLGHSSALEPDTYRQAGALLALLHGQSGLAVIDNEYEAQVNARALKWLASDHRIDSEITQQLKDEIASWPTPPTLLVPTHGDWHPRNWLIHDGVVSVIDFGRAMLRPSITDFARLAAQEFRGHPELEAAFFEGYGPDPRAQDPEAWRRERIRQAIGTAAWAYQVGDTEFEAQGHRMIAEIMGEGACSKDGQ